MIFFLIFWTKMSKIQFKDSLPVCLDRPGGEEEETL